MLIADGFQDVLRRLPIPLIGVPWYQTFHLPGALIVAHETGHIIEFDFGLTDEIAAARVGAGLAQASIWKGWASEVFADMYGCLRVGPAFVGAMMNLLATSVDFIQREEKRSGRYPTRALRIELLLEALAQLGHGDESRRLRSNWEGVYGPMQKMSEFKPDVPMVVKAIYAGPYKGDTLTSLGSFATHAVDRIRLIARTAAANDRNKLAQFTEPRELFAAAEWLHENPQKVQSPDANKLLVGQVVEKGRYNFRNRSGKSEPDKAAIETEIKSYEEADRRSGRELREYLLTLSACPQPADGPRDLPEL
jgi:hypothetical protein